MAFELSEAQRSNAPAMIEIIVLAFGKDAEWEFVGFSFQARWNITKLNAGS